MKNLTKEEVEELNGLLTRLELPRERKQVAISGRNLAWLRRNLAKKEDLTPRLKELLRIN